MKPCTVCNLNKGREFFRKDARLLSGHASSCRECEAIRSRRWKKNNPEKVKKSIRSWVERNKVRNSITHLAWLRKNAKRAQAHSCNAIAKRRVSCAPIDTDLLVSILDTANGVCGYCKATEKKLGFDHKTPLYKGGKHEVENLIACCVDCNRSKNRKTFDEFTSVLRQTE